MEKSPATGMARAFRNGMTLDAQTKIGTKCFKSLELRSYMVKFFIFVRPISHWLRLGAQFGIKPCNGYGQGFPKWYDT